MEQGQRQFRKASSDIKNVWDPRANEKNSFYFEATNDQVNIIDGYIVDVDHGVGIHNSTVWKMHEVLPDGKLGEIWAIWGDKVLNGELEKVTLGAFIRVQYKGKKFPKGKEQQNFTKNNSYHIWDVFVDDGAMPYNKANPSATIKQPAVVNTQQQGQQQQVQGQQQGAQQQQQVQQKPAFTGRSTAQGGGEGAQQQQGQQQQGNFGDDLPF